ncbi:glycosyltransferase family 2 protein [Janthinobacterium aquaticum]|uniref:glycosyltransferase family 2 protein n=1 Tax=Janthinobacterium sp. FT58W TaxID=2654254 RepID=UPI001264DAF1|nr:glycosyltransferase family A protein [Janthinobacterium sp. FT58W]KAB8044432.1 glycosyltransferase [Janthinobacterium sp. FT58W]
MTENVSLSIIVPAYNVQDYIGATFASITEQMRATHELIFVDDGSTDGTLAALQTLKQNRSDLNITLFEQRNQGVAAARNQGLALARGEYIVFVDSDDLLLPGSLDALDRVIVEAHPDVIACDLQFWHPQRESKNKRITSGFMPDVLTTSKDEIRNRYFDECHMFVWSKIFRRDIYLQHTMPVFPPGRVYEDVTAMPQLLDSCNNLYYLPHCLINYRQRDGSISKTGNLRTFLELSTALLPARRYFSEQGLNDTGKMHFDIAMCHIYIGIVKDTYQLPLRQGYRFRKEIQTTLLNALFHPWQEVVAVMARAGMPAPIRDIMAAQERAAFRRKQARQLTQVLGGSISFGIRQTISRTVRTWRTRLRRGSGATAAA